MRCTDRSIAVLLALGSPLAGQDPVRPPVAGDEPAKQLEKTVEIFINPPFGRVPMPAIGAEPFNPTLFGHVDQLFGKGPAGRIWAPTTGGRQEVGFRRRLKLDAAPFRARLIVSCDNEFEAFVNGRSVGSGTDWQRLTAIDVTLNAGDNLIAIRGRNTGSAAGLVAWLVWIDAAGKEHELVTDETWRVGDGAPAGFQRVEFDDSDWPAAKQEAAARARHNVHNGIPTGVDQLGRWSRHAESLESAVQKFRRARDPQAAHRALIELETAVMAARRELWNQTPKASTPPRSDRARQAPPPPPSNASPARGRTEPATPSKPGNRRRNG